MKKKSSSKKSAAKPLSKSLLKEIAKSRANAAKVHSRLLSMESLAFGKAPKGAAAVMAADAQPATKRQKVISQLIGIVHSMGVNSPNVGPASVYANPPIGFSDQKMLSYCQTCRSWFGCPGLADQQSSLSVNEMATAVINAGGEPR